MTQVTRHISNYSIQLTLNSLSPFHNINAIQPLQKQMPNSIQVKFKAKYATMSIVCLNYFTQKLLLLALWYNSKNDTPQ